MALSHRLELRQSQSLVMTPQLQQAIKLLQLSNLELNEFVDTELERNPLLENKNQQEEPTQTTFEPEEIAQDIEPQRRSETDEWLSKSADNMKEDPSTNLDSRVDDIYPDLQGSDRTGLSEQGWSSLHQSKTSASNGSYSENYNLESYVKEEITLHAHLLDQLHLSKLTPSEQLIGAHLIDMVELCCMHRLKPHLPQRPHGGA